MSYVSATQLEFWREATALVRYLRERLERQDAEKAAKRRARAEESHAPEAEDIPEESVPWAAIKSGMIALGFAAARYGVVDAEKNVVLIEAFLNAYAPQEPEEASEAE